MSLFGLRERKLLRWIAVLTCVAMMGLAALLGLFPTGAVASSVAPRVQFYADDYPAPTSTEHSSLVLSQARAGNYPNCRLGVGAVIKPITTYNFTPLRLGWYVDWRTSASPVRPNGIDYYHTIRVSQDVSSGVYLPTYHIKPPLDFSSSGLGGIVQANPGSIWLVGNEPDIPSQDNVEPEVYAQIYHDTYQFIKSIDPTARVAIGAVVQPTPVRLQYLDMILQTYQTKFGRRMPIDVWNVHMYIIREVKDDWGARIPPGIDVITGTVFTLNDHVDSNIFRDLVVDMRTWMKDHGYQDKPLIVSEFGILMPLWFLDDAGVTQDDALNFIRDTVNYMNTATDANLGYPADDYRLVQQAALYSLDDDSVFPTNMLLGQDYYGLEIALGKLDEIPYKWGSFLFHSTNPYTITASGTYYRDVIAANLPANVDVLPYHFYTTPGALIVSPGETISPTLQVLVANIGNSSPADPVTVRFFDVTGGGNTQIGTDVILSPFTGCGALREASVVWPNLSPGRYSLRIKVDPDNQIAESQESNNMMTVTVLVGTYGIYLPIVSH